MASKTITFRLDERLKATLRAIASGQGRDVSDIMRELAVGYVAQMEPGSMPVADDPLARALLGVLGPESRLVVTISQDTGVSLTQTIVKLDELVELGLVARDDFGYREAA